MNENKKRQIYGIFFIVFVLLSLLLIYTYSQQYEYKILLINDFYNMISQKKIKDVIVSNHYIAYISMHSGENYALQIPNTNILVSHLIANNIPCAFTGYSTINSHIFNNLHLRNTIFNFLAVVVCYFALNQFLRYMFNNYDSVFGNKSEFNRSESKMKNFTFKNVVGMEVEKKMLMDFSNIFNMKNRYDELKCSPPNGLIMYGPPGNGKTYIAKAFAGETNANFFYASASSFVQLYVGMGALQIRQLFQKARKKAPAIIFIDEIDSIGKRDNIGHNSEYHNTINQLLTELDGFNDLKNVFVILATNRIQDIDPAIIRSGRIDKKILVGKPNMEDRVKILNHYLKECPLSWNFPINQIAKNLIGFSRADISTLVNETKLYVVSNKKDQISFEDIEKVKDEMIIGVKQKKDIMSQKELNMVAHHECGHAFAIDYYSKKGILDGIYKATVVPTGSALGFVAPAIQQEKKLISKNEIEAKIVVCLAGRIVEEVFFGNELTGGCSSDLSHARSLAENYIISGMDNNLSYISDNIYIRSESEKSNLDKRVNTLIHELTDETRKLVESNKEIIKNLAERLIELETMTGEEIANFIDNKTYPLVVYQIKSMMNLYCLVF